MKLCVLLIVLALLSVARACDVRVDLKSGAVCGLVDELPGLPKYARFLNVPYAQQPLGALRFKELQPVEPWTDDYDATVKGPICHQKDVFYGRMMQPAGMSEACIHANIFTPLDALKNSDRLPILVYIHGGAFQSGSSDTDFNGPEYFFDDNVVVITFNYRLNVFGFLSLNSTSVPGNNGLRDMITLLKWVQDNAVAFGGDPDNVTLMGQSSGGVSSHLLSLSPAAVGLFKRAVLISGTAINDVFTSAPAYAQYASNLFLANLGITETDPEEVHRILINLPIDTIMNAYYITQNQTGLVSFVPVVESEFEGVTRVLDGDPETLVRNGRGQDISLIVGFDTSEAYSLQPRINQLNVVAAVANNSAALVPARFSYSLSEDQVAEIGKKMKAQYFHGTVTLEQYLDFSSDIFFVYPAIKLANLRATTDAVDTFLYQFSYEGEYKIVQKALELNYSGVGHFEELTYLLRVNSILDQNSVETPKDDLMRKWVTSMVHDFMRCSKPICDEVDSSKWPSVQTGALKYQDIRTPEVYSFTGLTEKQNTMFEFFSSIDSEYST